MAALDRGSVALALRRGRVALGTGRPPLVPWRLMAALRRMAVFRLMARLPMAMLRWMAARLAAMLRWAKVWFLTAALRLLVRLLLTEEQRPGTVPSLEDLLLRVARRNL